MRMVDGRIMLLASVMLALLSGCSENHKAKATAGADTAANTVSQVIAVDVSAQGNVRMTSLPRGITALTAAETPPVILLGTEFVERHGTAPNGGKLPYQASQQLDGPQPLVAMVEGAADVFIGQAPLTAWLPELQLIESGLQQFKHRMDGDGRRHDTLVPYLRMQAQNSGAAGVEVKAAVLRGRGPALFLNADELGLLACLDGQAVETGGRSLSCHTEWSSNGDLKAPRINGAVTVTVKQVKQDDRLMLNREISEKTMAQNMTELVHRLQLQGTDPLDIGRTVRSLYRGVWTHERWRQAFSHAEIAIRLRLIS
ncbi:hypothetical protein GC093_22510 [Paenibacillus sp. LMG 31456]|uniref:Spore germination GerAC-like C-terminal domain-containing protein n=1 Tax=Paenibacillus foliorum TaxID=2654974 RepID=A0A972H465_9BACL|nr:Ger(x)C family spore germination C-terminal domain-containing protein [Paenibacillus foliorum]NOU95971.1 hypothetical protein [Paenibacillus foliorum]